MTTPLDLDAIRARLEAATPGPWEPAFVPGMHQDEAVEAAVTDGEHQIADCWDNSPAIHSRRECEANARFIAYARTDVGALLDECERLRKLEQRLTAEDFFDHERVKEERDAALAEVARLKARVAELEFVVRCPECGGEGEQTFDVVRGGNEHDTATVECPACKGTGTCQDIIGEVIKLRAERLAEDAVVAAVVALGELPRGVAFSTAICDPNVAASNAAVRKVIASLHALRAARAGKDGG